MRKQPTSALRMNVHNDRATWLKGGSGRCSIPPKYRLEAPRFVLLGGPGIGKGTQAEILCAGLSVCHLSIDDLFRAAKNFADEDQTPNMIAALSFLHRGATVPDETMLGLIRERMTCLHCRGGFLLDGFPRTVPQAVALDDMLQTGRLRLDAVLNYTLPWPTLIHRLSGRRTCQECQAVFHLSAHPPQVSDVCDYCGGVLVQSEDDLPEAIEERLLAYETNTRPLVQYYLGHGLLRTISAEGSPQLIYERTLAILET